MIVKIDDIRELLGRGRVEPDAVFPELYVKKSVANVLRNASGKHPELVLSICRQWAASGNPHTAWIVKDSLRKLKGSHPRDVAAVLQKLDRSV